MSQQQQTQNRNYLISSESVSKIKEMEVSSILMRFHQDQFLSEFVSTTSNDSKTGVKDSPFQRDPNEISDIVVKERVLQMLYSASLRKRLLGNRNDKISSSMYETPPKTTAASPGSKLCLKILRQLLLQTNTIPLEDLNNLLSEIKPLSMFREVHRKASEIGVPLDPTKVSPSEACCLIGKPVTTWKSKPGVELSRIQIVVPNDIDASTLVLRFPSHVSRTVKIVVRDSGGHVLSTSKEVSNNAIASARSFLLDDQKKQKESTIVQRIDLQDCCDQKSFTIELSRLKLPLLLQSFAQSVPAASQIPGTSSDSCFELSGIEIYRKVETYNVSDALLDIDRCLVKSIEESSSSCSSNDATKSITLLWKLALATVRTHTHIFFAFLL